MQAIGCTASSTDHPAPFVSEENPMNWTDKVQAISSVATPLVVAVLAFLVSRFQGRSEELVKARIEYYKVLAPRLNRLMCFMTFLGPWREIAPPEVIALKRSIDHDFYCACPLFSPDVLESYTRFMEACYATYGPWGTDPLLKSSAHPRREYWRGPAGQAWDPAWDQLFATGDQGLDPADVRSTRDDYDALIAAMVRDLDLTRARSAYTTRLVSHSAPFAPPNDSRTGERT
jgi:hypothetical protein